LHAQVSMAAVHPERAAPRDDAGVCASLLPGSGSRSGCRCGPSNAEAAVEAVGCLRSGARRAGAMNALLAVQAVALAGFVCTYLGVPWTQARGHRELAEVRQLREQNQRLLEETRQLQEVHKQLHKEARRLRRRNEHLRAMEAQRAIGPYESITGSKGHEVPEMYGKVKEKTIWSYWIDKKTCPSSKRCNLPHHVQLCVETVMKNKGSFDYKVLHIDEVHKYVNMFELPLRWRELTPQHQKDAIMNAILARYGGVALDITTLLLRPLDAYWDEMVAKGATFRGYMYRLNGQPYRHPEASVVWFLMSRRDGIFSSAVRNQVEGMGDRRNIVGIYHQFYFALGDQTLLPILTLFNYSFPKCYEDETLIEPASHCPEHEQPSWYKGIAGPERNDTKILLRDPRDGPHLPFAFSGMATWSVLNDTRPLPPGDPKFPPADNPGGPMYGEKCSSMKECWETVFLQRYHQPQECGEAPLLSFVKLFSMGKDLARRSRQEILSHKETFFYNWLKLAGLDV